MKIVALLPMKKNSQRVKGKNFRDLAGKPLFRWILDTLLEVEQIEQVVINTDARDILAEAGLTEAERVLIRDRKAALCGDFISMNRVLEDDIENVPADIYLMTHTTNPLVSADTLRKAITLYKKVVSEKTGDSVFTVNKVQTRFYRKDLSPVNHDPDNLIRTQDLEPWFEENSNIYVFSSESFAASKSRIGKKPKMLEMRRIESVDIDDADSWKIAEALAAHSDSYRSKEP